MHTSGTAVHGRAYDRRTAKEIGAAHHGNGDTVQAEAGAAAITNLQKRIGSTKPTTNAY